MDFQKEEVASEKEVILKEINMGADDPGRRLDKLLWETAFQVHPCRFPVIGYRDLFKNLTREEVIRYYTRRYVPNNMFLVAVGDFRPGDVLTSARKLFEPFPRKNYPEAALPPEPRQLGPRRGEVEMDVAQAHLALAFHIPSLHTPDLFALDVLALLAGRGRSSRLYRTLREEKKLVNSIGAYSYTPAFPGLFVVNAEADPGNLPAVEEGVLSILRDYREKQVSPAELSKARDQVISDYIHGLVTMEGQAGDLGSNQFTAGDPNFSLTYLEGISAVRPEDIQRAARRYLKKENMTAAAILPVRPAAAPLPVEETAEPKISRLTLDNGLTVLFRPDHSLPLVSVKLVFAGGVLAEDENDNGAFNLAARLLLKGTSSRSAGEIAREIEEKGGSISSYSARNSFGVSLEVLSPNLAPALDVLSDIATDSTFPPEEIEKERKIILDEIAAEKDSPRRLAARILREELFRNSPYRFSPLGTEESVKKLNRSKLKKVYHDYLTARNGVLAVYGDISPAILLPLLKEKLGGIPGGKKPQLAGRYSPPGKAKLEKTESKKKIDQAIALLGFHGTTVRDADRYPLELLSSISSGLSSPLFKKVRIEGGMAYYVGAYQILGLDPGAYVFYAGTVPGRTGEVVRDIWEEIDRVREGKITPEELRRNKNRLIGEDEFGRQSQSSLAFRTALDELYGLGYDNYRDYRKNIEAITLSDLKRAADKYFRPDDYALAVVRPEKKE
jgi:zinc protease